MEKVVVYYHKEMDTMDIWFGNPQDEVVSEEAGGGIILKKDKNGRSNRNREIIRSKNTRNTAAFTCSSSCCIK